MRWQLQCLILTAMRSGGGKEGEEEEGKEGEKEERKEEWKISKTNPAVEPYKSKGTRTPFCCPKPSQVVRHGL